MAVDVIVIAVIAVGILIGGGSIDTLVSTASEKVEDKATELGALLANITDSKLMGSGMAGITCLATCGSKNYCAITSLLIYGLGSADRVLKAGLYIGGAAGFWFRHQGTPAAYGVILFATYMYLTATVSASCHHHTTEMYSEGTEFYDHWNDLQTRALHTSYQLQESPLTRCLVGPDFSDPRLSSLDEISKTDLCSTNGTHVCDSLVYEGKLLCKCWWLRKDAIVAHVAQDPNYSVILRTVVGDNQEMEETLPMWAPHRQGTHSRRLFEGRKVTAIGWLDKGMPGREAARGFVVPYGSMFPCLVRRTKTQDFIHTREYINNHRIYYGTATLGKQKMFNFTYFNLRLTHTTTDCRTQPSGFYRGE